MELAKRSVWFSTFKTTIKTPFWEIDPKSYPRFRVLPGAAKSADRAAIVDEMIAACRKAWDERHN